MEEQIVELETAKLASLKGFMVSCPHTYDEDGNLESATDYTGQGKFTSMEVSQAELNTGKEHYLAPLQSVLRNWLFTECSIYVEVRLHSWSTGFDYFIRRKGYGDRNISAMPYEEHKDALEAGLREALTLI